MAMAIRFSSRFSSVVPVSTITWGALMRRIARAAMAETQVAAAAAIAPGAVASDPWAPLIDNALQWVQALADLRPGGPTAALVHTDPATGAPYLRLPLPEPAMLARLSKALSGLLARLIRGGNPI